MPEGVGLQRVRDFTVQIRRPDTGEIVGTGVVVAADGRVVTCAHVIEAALGVPAREARDRVVGVFFPRLAHREQERTATIIGIFPDHDDDVVLLKIVGAITLTPRQVAILGTAEESEGHPFQSYGYRRLDDRPSGWAEGTIQGLVEAPERGTFQSEPIQLSSSQINRGMSGAAVLDKERNLVIGLVSDTWFPDPSTKDRDTAWAVDARVLSLAPLNVPLRDGALPLRQTLQPPPMEPAPPVPGPRLGVAWNTAPSRLEDFMGRAEQLGALTDDWTQARTHVTGLIGFGGEGKSSLARRWVEQIVESPEGVRPDGVFWWGFAEKPDADDFFNALLEYMTAGTIDPGKIGSTTAKAQYVGAMLGRGRYLFVLDGVETIQHRDGDRYGEFQSDPVAAFLGYIAAPDARSFAIVTSRIQLHDLCSYTTYAERDVTRLGAGDGLALLRAIGVQGSDEQLTSVVEEWDGHALTLSLLGAYLVETHRGDVTRAAAIPAPTIGEHRDVRIQHVLGQYDERLSEAEQAAVTAISLPRVPVDPTVVFGPVHSGWDLPEALRPLAGMGAEALNELVDRLIAYRLVRYDAEQTVLSVHPLVRSHYRARLEASGERASAGLHLLIAHAYLAHAHVDFNTWTERAANFQDVGSLEELRPAIEAVYHAALGGDHDLAKMVQALWIDRGLPTSWLSVRLGAAEAALDVRRNFFPERDLSRDPIQLVHLNGAGVQLENLGRLDEAQQLYTRALSAGLEGNDLALARNGARNLGPLLVMLGDLSAAADAGDQCLELYARIPDDPGATDVDRAQDLATVAWIAAARGDDATATGHFEEAVALMKAQGVPLLMGKAGLNYAEYLYRRGDVGRAIEALGVVQGAGEHLKRIGDQAECHRFWGILFGSVAMLRVDKWSEYEAKARESLNLAAKLSTRSTADHQIAALATRGTWAARLGDLDLARQELQAALDRSATRGFRLRQAEAFTGLAWLRVAERQFDAARTAAQTAIDISRAAGYFWGMRDAEAAAAVADARQ